MIIKVVAALIRNEKGEILLAQRALNAKSCPGLWEFPGGKISPSESPERALIRELLEELDMNIQIERPFMTNLHKVVGENAVQLESYLAKVDATNFELRVHNTALWLKKEMAQNFNFAPADIPIFKKLLVTNWP